MCQAGLVARGAFACSHQPVLLINGHRECYFRPYVVCAGSMRHDMTAVLWQPNAIWPSTLCIMHMTLVQCVVHTGLGVDYTCVIQRRIERDL